MSQPVPQRDFEFEPPPPVLRGERSKQVAAHFRIDLGEAQSARRRRTRCPIELPSPGELMLLTGPSGSGKSSLLRALRRRAGRAATVIDLRGVPLPERPVVEMFTDASLEQTLKRLARVGLAEVWTWLRPPSQLSEGQRWRLRLALAIERIESSATSTLLVCDEFGAVLDRITACIVSNVLRRSVDAHARHLAAIVATSHDDLGEALSPDITIECDFGRVSVARQERAR